MHRFQALEGNGGEGGQLRARNNGGGKTVTTGREHDQHQGERKKESREAVFAMCKRAS